MLRMGADDKEASSGYWHVSATKEAACAYRGCNVEVPFKASRFQTTTFLIPGVAPRSAKSFFERCVVDSARRAEFASISQVVSITPLAALSAMLRREIPSGLRHLSTLNRT